MASGAITPGAAASPVQPIVNTRKNVPMNSVAYRRMARPFVPIVGPLRGQGQRMKQVCHTRMQRQGHDPDVLDGMGLTHKPSTTKTLAANCSRLSVRFGV